MKYTYWYLLVVAGLLLLPLAFAQSEVAAQQAETTPTPIPPDSPPDAPPADTAEDPPPAPVQTPPAMDWSKAVSPHVMEGTPEAPEPGPGGSPADPPPPPPPPPTSPPPAPPTGNVTTYVVQRGDNLYRIALRFGISLYDLAAANNMTNPNVLYVGQTLIIPIMTSGDASAPATEPPDSSSSTYVVQYGDTLLRIAQRFNRTVPALIAANALANPNLLYIGQTLNIPAAGSSATPQPTATALPTRPPLDPPPDGATEYFVQRGDSLYRIARRFSTTVNALVAANNLANPNQLFVGQRLIIARAASTPAPTRPPAPSTFIWPVEARRIVKWYSWGHPGIDIVLPVGEPVIASAAGVVEYAGWNNYGYGYLVVIDHGDGVRSLYAHHSKLLVETGQSVAQGEIIALVGSTGNSNMPHVHLELIFDNQRLNPCGLLPGGC